jgi:hypothetical protein
LPIHKRVSVIWKHRLGVVSHAAAGALPITPGYRKEDESMRLGGFVIDHWKR